MIKAASRLNADLEITTFIPETTVKVSILGRGLPDLDIVDLQRRGFTTLGYQSENVVIDISMTAAQRQLGRIAYR